MIFKRDNLLINGDNLRGLQLLQGIQLYDLILINSPNRKKGDTNWGESFQKRLELSYPLLKEDGAIAIFSDDNNYPFVRMICNMIFQEENYMNTFILKKEPLVEKKSRVVHPFGYLVVYRKSERFAYTTKEIMDTNMLHYPIDDEKGYEKYHMTDVKNVKAIKKLLTMLTNPTSNILDFYAGSGSTGQAVLELNYEENSSRKFTLITDDKKNICYPRIQKQSFIFNTLFDYLILEDK